VSNHRLLRTCLCGLGLMVVAGSVGCQSDYAGQTLPSPYWLVDDVQYFPAGPEFKLTNEANALKTYGGVQKARTAPGPLGPQDGAPRPGLVEPEVPAGAPGVRPVPGAAVPAPPAAGVPGAGMPAEGAPPVAPPADADPFATP